MAMHNISLSRRALLRGVSLVSAGMAVNPLLSSNVFAEDKPLKTIKLAWGQTAVCQAPISVAVSDQANPSCCPASPPTSMPVTWHR